MAAIVSVGTVLQVENGGVFADVGQVQSIKLSGDSWKVVDAYVLGRTYPIRKVTTRDPQNVELKLLFDPSIAAHEAFRTGAGSNTAKNYKVILSDDGLYTYTFSAVVTKFEKDEFSAEGAEVVVNVTLEITEPMVVTP